MIYITGDTHGDINELLGRKIKGLRKGDKLIITGDFGFIWDNSKNELKNLQKLSKKKFDILFVEGAHENFELLSKYKDADLYCGTGIKIDHNIYCLKRGELYNIDGFSVFTLGGGADITPIDDSYINAKSMPTDEEYENAIKKLDTVNRSVDLIITHEAPASVKRLINRDSTINELNLFLDTVLQNTKFKSWYFGSLHADRQISQNMTCVWKEVHKIS